MANDAIAIFYAVGGPLIHLYLITQHPEVYAAVDNTAVPIYQFLWQSLVLQNLIPLVIVLIGLEMIAGVLMFSRQPYWSRLGHLGGLVFNLLLIPFLFYYGVVNLLMVALHLWLLLEPSNTVRSKPRPASY